MTTLASWSGDGLSADTTWTGELGTGDTTTAAVTVAGGSTVATSSATVPPGTRNTGMTLRIDHAVNNYGYAKWTNSGGVVGQNSGRIYYRTAAHIGTGHCYPITFYSGTTQMMRLRWDGAVSAVDMVLRMYQGDGTLQDTSTVALAASTWYRIEWQMDSSYNIEMRFYDIASSEYTEVSGLTLIGALDGGIDNIRIGASAYNTVAQADTWWDDLLWTDTAEWLGQYGREDAAPTVTAPSLPITASAGTSAEGFVSGSNGTTTTAPAMAATAVGTATVAGYVTTTAPAVALTAPTPYLGAQTLASGASYHDTIGDSTSRTFNLFAPLGTAPPSGWPLVLYVHGGSWNGGSRNSLPARILNHLISLDYAVASIDYELTEYHLVFNTNTGATHPEPVSDTLCALKHIVNGYDINPDRVVMFGTSAGGHVALEAAITRSDTHAYTWGFTRSGLRQDADPQTNPTFNYDQGSRTGIPDVAGLFLVAAPIDCEWIYTNGWGDDLFTTETGPASLAVRLYGGQLPNNSYSVATAAGELNLDSLITGETGTVYAGYSHTPDFPIAYVEATNDIVVPADAGITPLTAALDAMSYDTSTGVDVVNTVGGLTHFQESVSTADEHDEVELHFDLQQLTDWLDALFVDASITTTAPAVGLTVPTPAVTVDAAVTITAPAVVAATDPGTWVQVDGRKTITAPTVAVNAVVPVPHVGKNITTAAPLVGFDNGTITGEGGVVGVATAQGAQFSVPAPGVKIGKNIVVTAPTLAVTAGASTAAVGKFAYVTAPAMALTATATADTAVGVTTTAPMMALGPGTATGSAGRQVNAPPVAMALAAAVGFTIRRGAVTVAAAPRATITVPTPQASSSTASALLFRAPRSSRRPDFTRATRRESTE